MLPPPDSILPPAPRLKTGAKSAAVAVLITVALSVIGVGLSFYIAHAESLVVRAIATAVYWPAFSVMLAFGDSGIPRLVFHVLAFGAEFAYVWAVVSVISRVVRAPA